jgi:hypothetical protein
MRTLSLLGLLLLHCAPGRGIEVTVAGLTADLQGLGVAVSFPDEPALRWPAQQLGREERFVLRLPDRPWREVVIDIAGLNQAGCQRAAGQGRAGPGQAVDIALVRLPREQWGCRLVIDKAGGGRGRVAAEKGEIDCPLEDGTCTATFAPGTPLRLLATPEKERAFFAGWSGACAGRGACEVVIGSGITRVVAGLLPRRVCQAGFCWENPLPQGNHLSALWVSAEDDAWAAGGAGTVLRWNGAYWAVVRLAGPREEITGLWARTGNDVWAVGAGGLVLHFDGATWMRREIAPPRRLQAVWGRGERAAWAVGEAGTVLRWDGAAWRAIESGTTQRLAAVWGCGERDVWAAGDAGTVLRWDGAAWRTVPAGTDRDLAAVFCTGDAVWIAGAGGTARRWDGAAFVPVAGADADLTAVWGSAPGDIWLAGRGGALYHHDGSPAPLVLTHSDTRSDLLAVRGAGPSSGFAVGRNGTIVRWNGAFWTSATNGHREDLLHLSTHRSHPVVVINDRGSTFERQAPGWILTGSSHGGPYHAGHLVDGSWLAGPDGLVLHRDSLEGTSWRRIPADTAEPLWGIGQFFALPDEAWAVGGKATVLRWTRGGSFQSMRHPLSGTDRTLYAVDGAGANVWMAGDRGTLLRWNGSALVQVPSGTTARLRGLWVGARVRLPDVWAVGDGGTVLRSTGGDLATLPSGTTANLRAVTGFQSGVVWIVGEGGTVLRWDGRALSSVPAPVANHLYAVAGSSPGEIWVAGEGGAILHYAASNPQGGPR